MLSALLLLAAQAALSLIPDYAHDETAVQSEARAVALHRRMDLNGDGYVTQAEMARYLAGLVKGLAVPGTAADPGLPPRARAEFAATDTDHDGRISLAEAIAAARRNFDAQDSNHDGVVTPAERMAFLRRAMLSGKTPDGVPLLPAMPVRPSACADPAGCGGR